MTATPGDAAKQPKTGPGSDPATEPPAEKPSAPRQRDQAAQPLDAPGGTDELVTEPLPLPTAASAPTVATGTASEKAVTETETDAAAGGPAPAHRAPRAVFGRSWWIKATIVGLCALLGLSLAAQLRRNEHSNAELSSARQQDLVRILDELDSREQRLRLEINQLEERQRNLGTAAAGSQAVLADLEQRAQELGILAGTLPAEGTGVKLVFRGGRPALPAAVILGAVEELRGAGAEALQISGSAGSGGPVRIVASTSFLDDNGELLIGDRRLTAPYTVLAIGDGPTMRAALAIPGGVVDSARDAGGTVAITTPDVVAVTATRRPTTPKYATPVD